MLDRRPPHQTSPQNRGNATAASGPRSRSADHASSTAWGPAPLAARPSLSSESAAAGTPSEPLAAATVADLSPVRAVIDAVPEAVLVTESDGRLRLTNPAADQLFASRPVHDRADLLSRFEDVPADHDESRRRGIRLPATGQTAVTVRARDAPDRWFAIRAVALDPTIPIPARATIGDSATIGSVATERDGLAATASSADGLAAAASSADPIAPEPDGRTVFVLRDVTDSRDLRPVREAFLAVLSHELRTPITTIYAGSSVLARRPTLSPPASQTLARDISAEAARLYDLVEDLLVLARLERRVLDPLDEPVLIQHSVDTTIRMATERIADIRIERRGDPDPPPVHGDATYVEQVCRNLILAASRHASTEPGWAIIVELRTDKERGEVAVAALDRGPGLSADEVRLVFELPRASASGRLGASGVGLFVCRQLIEAMGGRTWARNRDGGGMETGFALPIHAHG